jgi:hypothetical protein
MPSNTTIGEVVLIGLVLWLFTATRQPEEDDGTSIIELLLLGLSVAYIMRVARRHRLY